MNENSNLLPDLLHEEFKLEVRGYSRRQVDDFVALRNSQMRDMEQRLSRALDEADHLRRELSATRQQALNGRPAHQEVPERIAAILKLADDEARAQKDKASEDIARFRGEALTEIDRMRADAREQTERMLTAAQEQAERAVATARLEADKTRTTARAEADRLTDDARKKADTSLASAKAQSKRMLDEATARATAIHDGAERRLNLLSTRHAETIRRLSDILEGVSGLVAAETSRPSLEDEVAMTAAKAVGSRPAEIIDGTDGVSAPSALAESSLLSPPHPMTRVNGPGAPSGAMTGLPGAGATAALPRGLGRGPRQAGSPIASPAQQPGPTATPPIATPAPQPGQGAMPPITAPASQPDTSAPSVPSATPHPATPSPQPGAGTTPPAAPPAPQPGSSPAGTAGTSTGGETARPGTHPGSADAATAELGWAIREQADGNTPKASTGPGSSDPDEPTDGAGIPPG